MFGRLLGCYIVYTFSGADGPTTEFHHVQNSLCVQVLRSPTLGALLHGTQAAGSAKLCGVVQGMELRNFRRGRHLYSAERPSRWASAHILVFSSIRPFSIVIHYLWPPYVIGGPLYFCPVVSFFFFFLFFPRLISAAVDWMSAILLHMAWP